MRAKTLGLYLAGARCSSANVPQANMYLYIYLFHVSTRGARALAWHVDNATRQWLRDARQLIFHKTHTYTTHIFRRRTHRVLRLLGTVYIYSYIVSPELSVRRAPGRALTRAALHINNEVSLACLVVDVCIYRALQSIHTYARRIACARWTCGWIYVCVCKSGSTRGILVCVYEFMCPFSASGAAVNDVWKCVCVCARARGVWHVCCKFALDRARAPPTTGGRLKRKPATKLKFSFAHTSKV